MPRVLYLAGAGRSGSTLLGMVLGQLPDFFNVGEIKWFWSDAHDGSRLCGCGVPVAKCPFWARVASDLSKDSISISQVALKLVPRLTRTRNLPRLATGKALRRPSDEWSEFVEVTRRLYQAVHQRCQGKVIVDGSKLPPHLVLLEALPELDLRLVHLVRDGRGVAYSWQKRWEAQKTRTQMRDFRVGHRGGYKAFLIWILQNWLTRRLSRDRAHKSLLRYEDFVTDTRGSLERVFREVGLQATLPEFRSGEIRLRRTHAIAGSSAVRFGAERRRIALDDHWRREMNSRTRLILSLIGMFSLRRYGYRVLLREGSASSLQ